MHVNLCSNNGRNYFYLQSLVWTEKLFLMEEESQFMKYGTYKMNNLAEVIYIDTYTLMHVQTQAKASLIS